MKPALQMARSVVAIACVLVRILVFGLLRQRLVLWPLSIFRRGHLRAWTSPCMGVQCRGTLGLLHVPGCHAA